MGLIVYVVEHNAPANVGGGGFDWFWNEHDAQVAYDSMEDAKGDDFEVEPVVAIEVGKGIGGEGVIEAITIEVEEELFMRTKDAEPSDFCVGDARRDQQKDDALTGDS